MTRSSGYDQIPDQPNVNFGRAVIKISVFVDEMLFIHRLSGDLNETKNFVGIHIAYLQKQLQQNIILKHINIELVVVHFSVAPFYDTHSWDTFKFLNRFCRWARTNSSQFSDVNILLTG
jgi:radical SAM superfamily enzyme with C-terminal helix-hairpin-helix motif